MSIKQEIEIELADYFDGPHGQKVMVYRDGRIKIKISNSIVYNTDEVESVMQGVRLMLSSIGVKTKPGHIAYASRHKSDWHIIELNII